MDLSRRDLCLLLPALAAAGGRAAETAALPSTVKRFEDLAVRAEGGNRFRPIVEGATHDGYHIEAHQTELAAGSMPHPAHRHRHEEMFLIREGKVEVTVNSRRTRLGPGGAAYIASNEEHGVRNVGTVPALYFVIALGRD